MKKLLFFLSIFFALSVFSQNRESDKSFINLNYQAIILVQKHMVAKQLTNYQNDFKKLLVWQVESVKLYTDNKVLSLNKAKLIRQECLKFMQIHSPNSLPYFKKDMSDNSNTELSEISGGDSSSLSEKLLSDIQSIDVTDLNSTKNLALRLL